MLIQTTPWDKRDMDIVKDLADLTAKRKLLPFLGAGCSKAMLSCDWDSVIEDMAAELGNGQAGHLEVAQEYVERFGKEGLCEFLKKYFIIDEFNEEYGGSHMAVMCSIPHIIYTTNQDNVMEKCFEKFRRRIRPVIELEDLVEADSDELLYIKFHGDLSVPDSVVFTREDYEKRMKEESFLNIRLRSDMLGRQLLFIGYSFRDEDIQRLFEEIRKITGGKLPDSYLIAFAADQEFIKRCESYHVQVIVPQEIFPELSAQDAFDRFLSEWNQETFKAYMSSKIKDIFSPGRRVCRKVITPSECRMLEEVLPDIPVAEAIRKFRGLVDQAVIPETQEQRVAGVFFRLCERCDSQELVNEFQGASFNLYLGDGWLRFYQAAYVYSLANLCDSDETAGVFSVKMPKGIPRKIGVFIGAYAIYLLRKWKRPITKYFQSSLIFLCDSSVQYDSLGPEWTGFCREQYDYVWNTYRTTLEHPLKRQKRIHAPLASLTGTDYDKILDSMTQMMPKEIKH